MLGLGRLGRNRDRLPLHCRPVRLGGDGDIEVGAKRTVRIADGHGRLVDRFPVLADEDAAFLLADKDRDGLAPPVRFLQRLGGLFAGGGSGLVGLNRSEGGRSLHGFAPLRLLECSAGSDELGAGGDPCRLQGCLGRGSRARARGLCAQRRRRRPLEHGKLGFGGLEVGLGFLDVSDGLAGLGSGRLGSRERFLCRLIGGLLVGLCTLLERCSVSDRIKQLVASPLGRVRRRHGDA